MSLIRQIWLLIVATLLLAFLGSFGVWMVSSRDYLETQLKIKNADTAQSLALSLSQLRGDSTAMDLAISAMYDTGFYQRITLRDAAGRVLSEHESTHAGHMNAPQWFVALMPVDSAPGTAQVSDGWRAVGSVEVVSQSAFAHGQLWQGSLRTAGLLAALAMLSGLVGALGVRRIRRPLEDTVNQAQALMERRFVTVPEPAVPELARLSRAMNAVVTRLRSMFEEQSTQVEQLRRQAHCDPLTGLAHRQHVMGQLRAMVASEDGSGQGLIYLVRVVDLVGLNRLLGHRQTDALLQKLAQTMLQESQGVAGAAIGRLNGGDFLMCLPTGDVPAPQPQQLAEALKRAFAEQALGASAVLGGCSWSRGMSLQTILACADSALAKAEGRGAFAVEMQEGAVAAAGGVLGEDEWRRRLTQALQESRMQLVRFPVVDRQLKLLHHECPLRLQLDPLGAFEPAVNWLPMAVRTGLISHIDEAAVSMALAQIEQDQMPRGVNLSPASLMDSSFIPRLRVWLTTHPLAARSLWVEVPEVAAVSRFDLVQELCQQLRPLGARVGLEHAGERLTQLSGLMEAGLDFVKLDASVVQGVHADAARAAFVTASVNLMHSLGLQVYAEGVNDPADILILRQCGIDGVTGPAVRLV